MTTPDRWVVLKILSVSDGTFYKVLGSWYGGYANGNFWRLNSGIQRVVKASKDNPIINMIGFFKKIHFYFMAFQDRVMNAALIIMVCI